MTSTPIAIDDLPDVVTAYLAAHRARDADGALARCTADIEVTDEGNLHRGAERVRAWMAKTSTEFTFTTDVLRAERVDDRRYVVTHRIVGDFPGSPVDLRFDIGLTGSKVASVVIAP